MVLQNQTDICKDIKSNSDTIKIQVDSANKTSQRIIIDILHSEVELQDCKLMTSEYG